MIETLSSYFGLIVYIVIGGIFLTLCFFIITGMADNRQLQLQEKQLKAELQAAKKAGRSEEDLAELERLRTKEAAHLETIKLKTQEIEKITGQLDGLTEDHRRLETKLGEFLKEKDEIQSVMNVRSEEPASQEAGRSEEDLAEIERARAQVAANLEAMKQKNHEIEKLTELLEQVTEDRRRLEAQLSESAKEKDELGRLRSDVTAKDQELAQLRKERLACEARIAQAEKILAAFAEGKESGEFRKSIHLDELTRKEDEIKDIKNKEP
jgi:chromosome segregation ATPase